MDDVLVFGKDQAEHDERLTAILKQIKSACRSDTQPRQVWVWEDQVEVLGRPDQWEWHSWWSWQNLSHCRNETPRQCFGTKAVHGDGESAREIHPKSHRAHTATSRASYQEKHVALGAQSEPSLLASQSWTCASHHTRTLWCRGSDKDFSGCIPIWVGCSTAAGSQLLLETSRICFSVDDRDWTLICPKRKGGTGHHVGLWEVCRLHPWQEIHNWNRPQATSPTSRDKAPWWLTSQGTPISTATHTIWCNISPAELLMGREIWSNLPQVEEKLIPQWPYLEKFRSCNQEYTQKQKFHYDQCHRVWPLPDDLEVWVSTEGRQSRGHVIAPSNAPRSYIVEIPTGQLHLNCSHLNPIPNDRQTNTDERPSSDTMSNRSLIMMRSRTGTSVAPPLRFEPTS